MTKARNSWRILVAIAILGLHAQGAFAKTVVVSKDGINCFPAVTTPLFTTIQAAVDSLPVAASASHTVQVCPGIYPEQIKITKPVTITGVLRDGTDPVEIDGQSGEARIVPPAGGLTANLVDATGSVAAQIAAQNVADLNLTNLSIDGTNMGCPVGSDGLPLRTAGIALFNVGVVAAGYRATIRKSVVHNQISLNADGTHCYSAEGILVEQSWSTIDSNSISNVDLNPIHQIGGISKISKNWLNLGWHGIVLTNTAETAAPNNAGSTISANTVSSFSTGIYLEASSNVLVTQNTLSNWTGDAIVLYNGASSNTVTSNTIIDAWRGIYLNSGAAGNVVMSNTVVRSVKIAIVDVYSGGGNTITGNTINQSPIGIFTINPGTDVINPNNFYNVTTLNGTGPWVP